MEYILRPIYQERASLPETLGVIIVKKVDNIENITDTFDCVLLIIVKEAEVPVFTKHYLYKNQKMVMHVITEEILNKWLFIGTKKQVVDWIFNGKIMFDRNEYLVNLRTKLHEEPYYGRKIKTGIQFSKLIRRVMEGKDLFNRGNFLDAYSNVIESLHHLARLSVLDKGLYPEVTVWSQVKKIQPEIYKLYEELLFSKESLEKKLELLFLAIEFMINARTHDGAQHLLETMLEKDLWTIQELHTHKELRFYSGDLEVLIEYLIDKAYIIVKPIDSKNQTIQHRSYTVDKKLVELEYDL
ncbi:nucleotidyltransferase-like protein [Ureibacillus sp. MALMAid1270]|uniref:nucleotidyltransferase-like protein n=1 Tax=Ureibacillus sp. MALMAid1270 TaxID=3411629 RepID=UPI003BA7CE64